MVMIIPFHGIDPVSITGRCIFGSVVKLVITIAFEAIIGSSSLPRTFALVAQWIRRATSNREIASSSLAGGVLLH